MLLVVRRHVEGRGSSNAYFVSSCTCPCARPEGHCACCHAVREVEARFCLRSFFFRSRSRCFRFLLLRRNLSAVRFASSASRYIQSKSCSHCANSRRNVGMYESFLAGPPALITARNSVYVENLYWQSDTGYRFHTICAMRIFAARGYTLARLYHQLHRCCGIASWHCRVPLELDRFCPRHLCVSPY